jgi:outer membrane protein assembly factor BamE (lipoprotein component of BamABCDE complex)
VTVVAVPAGVQALAAPPPSANAAATPPAGTHSTEIKPGMTAEEVRGLLGDPQAEMVFGEKTRWSYAGLTVIFVKGRVADVQF